MSEMERLIGVLDGRWKCAVRYEPNPGLPAGGSAEGWEQCRVGPGRWSVIFETHAHGSIGDFAGAGYITFDSAQRCYRLTWLSSMSPEPGLFTGRWTEGGVVFDGYEYLGQQRFAARHSITEIGADGFLYTVDRGPTATTLGRAATIRYFR